MDHDLEEIAAEIEAENVDLGTRVSNQIVALNGILECMFNVDSARRESALYQNIIPFLTAEIISSDGVISNRVREIYAHTKNKFYAHFRPELAMKTDLPGIQDTQASSLFLQLNNLSMRGSFFFIVEQLQLDKLKINQIVKLFWAIFFVNTLADNEGAITSEFEEKLQNVFKIGKNNRWTIKLHGSSVAASIIENKSIQITEIFDSIQEGLKIASELLDVEEYMTEQ